MQLIVLPPKDDGYYVTRELGESMFNRWVNYNPYGAVVYATKLRDEEHEKVKVIDAQASNLSHAQVRWLIKTHKPDKVTYFLGAFSLSNDLKTVLWKMSNEFFVSPFNVNINELMEIYKEYPFEKEQFIQKSELLTGKADFSFIDLNKYDMLRININDFCPFRCTFCDRAGLKVKIKPLEDTLEELKYVLKFRKQFFLFGSEISLKKDIILQLAEWLIHIGNKIPWITMDRVDLVEKDFYAELVKAGLKLIELGVESGSQRCLDSVNKGITIEDVINAFDILREFKTLQKSAFFIIGFPVETFEDLWASIRLVWKIQPNEINMDMLYPSPNTPMYKKMKRDGKLKTLRWEFYKHLKRRTLVFHHDRYENYAELVRDRCLVTMMMDAGLLTHKLSWKIGRQFKNEALSLLKVAK